MHFEKLQSVEDEISDSEQVFLSQSQPQPVYLLDQGAD